MRPGGGRGAHGVPDRLAGFFCSACMPAPVGCAAPPESHAAGADGLSTPPSGRGSGVLRRPRSKRLTNPIFILIPRSLILSA